MVLGWTQGWRQRVLHNCDFWFARGSLVLVGRNSYKGEGWAPYVCSDLVCSWPSYGFGMDRREEPTPTIGWTKSMFTKRQHESRIRFLEVSIRWHRVPPPPHHRINEVDVHETTTRVQDTISRSSYPLASGGSPLTIGLTKSMLTKRQHGLWQVISVSTHHTIFCKWRIQKNGGPSPAPWNPLWALCLFLSISMPCLWAVSMTNAHAFATVPHLMPPCRRPRVFQRLCWIITSFLITYHCWLFIITH